MGLVRSFSTMRPEPGTAIARVLRDLDEPDSDWRRRATSLLSDLRAQDWGVLGAWDTAATFGPSQGHVDLNDRDFVITDTLGEDWLNGSLMLDPSEIPGPHDHALINYGPQWPWVKLQPQMSEIGHTRHDPAELLEAIRLAVDRVDAALFLPADMRRSRLSEWALRLNWSEDRFRRFVLWRGAFTDLLP
jgi:hypothetical protein